MRITFLIAAFIVVSFFDTARANSFDGEFFADGFGHCSKSNGELGMAGGFISVVGNMFHGLETSCKLTNPITVRGMGAILYDAECSGEGTNYKERNHDECRN